MNLQKNEDGFTLIEVIVTITVLTLVTIPLAMVMYSGLGYLRDSENRSDGIEIAQQQIEVIRSMSYSDIGVVAGSVPGTLPATQTVTLRDQQVKIDTAVIWVDDAVPGGFVSTADYKQVTVTISFPEADINPVVQTTLISPSGKSGKTLQGLVEVNVVEVGSSNADLSPMAPVQIFMVGGPAPAPTQVYQSGDSSKLYAGLTPNPQVDPSDPNYEYELRMGSSLSDNSGSYLGQVWWLSPADFSTGARVRSLENNTINETLRVFRAATFDLQIQGSTTGSMQPLSATASDEKAGAPAGNAVDGSTGTYWSTNVAAGFPQYLIGDLGVLRPVTGVQIEPGPNPSGYIDNYEIWGSADGAAWTLLSSGDWDADSSTKTATFASSQVRYIKVEPLSSHGDHAEIGELTVSFNGGVDLVDFDSDLSASLRTEPSCSLGDFSCGAPEEAALTIGAGAALSSTFDQYLVDAGVTYGIMPGEWIAKISHSSKNLTCDASCVALGGVVVVPGGTACEYIEIPLTLEPAVTNSVDLSVAWSSLDALASPQTSDGVPECS